jgi:autophagy-related protein 2
MVWKWFNFSWTDSIKKRACRALLNRYLGKYLDQKLELDGMTIDLANGSCKVENVRLSAEVLNATLEEVHAPVYVESGVMSHISVTVPWMALMRENCSVDIQGITLEVGFRSRKDTPNINGMSLTDSLLVSTGQTSMDIASEVTEEEVNMDDNYGGVDALAKAIQHSVCVYVCVRACMHACMCV